MSKDFYKNKEVVILGGTGSLGKTLLQLLQQNHRPKGIRIFSRDEYKQYVLKQELAREGRSKNILFALGDVRDNKRLYRVFTGADIVINCAAQKHVPSCEENPLEAVKTNIIGATSIIEAAIDADVDTVFQVSTDKAVYPINLYGATKTVAEKLFIDGNVYSGGNCRTKFSAVRYGNVLGSRGSILPLFRALAASGKPIPITDARMTRFFIRLPEVAQFILDRIPEARGGEIFIPKMKAIKIIDFAKMLLPECVINITGIRAGEKFHEVLIGEEEARWRTEGKEAHYVIHSTDRKENIKAAAYTSEYAAKYNPLTKEDLEKPLYL